MSNRPFSTVSAAQLTTFINMVVDAGNLEDFDVYVDTQKASLICVHRTSCEGEEIECAQIMYGVES